MASLPCLVVKSKLGSLGHSTETIQVVGTTRRSANYKPSSWDYDAIQSLGSNFNIVDKSMKRVEELKKEAICSFFSKGVRPFLQMEKIDTIQRLGLGYHFEQEIKSILDAMTSSTDMGVQNDHGLYETALYFRLLRQHGCEVSQDVFRKFVDEKGEFKEYLFTDVKGLLSLYEASQLWFDGESLLEEAKAFSLLHLKDNLLKDCIVNQSLKAEVESTMEVPVNRRIPWPAIKSYIGIYEKRLEAMEPCLLEMAQLNFNTEQAKHQDELKSLSRWWRKMGLAVKLEFARDRCVEAYYWSLAIIPGPQYAYCREQLAKIFLFITTIDDVYDVYGTLDELELFTDAVDRWDIDAVEQLPEYMKICFLALYNTINQVSYEILKEQGVSITPFLSKMWGDMCKSFMVEAKWFGSGYTPSFEEYLKNGLISCTAPLILVHAFCLMGDHKININDMDFLQQDPEPIILSSIIFRLSNDLATSKVEAERGDAPGSLQCFMKEAGLSEASAEEHMLGLIEEARRKMMKEYCCAVPSTFPKHLVNLAMNLARTVEDAYHKGDGYSAPSDERKRQVMSVLIQPISIRYQSKRVDPNPWHDYFPESQTS